MCVCFGRAGSQLPCVALLQLQRAGAPLLVVQGLSHCGAFSCGGARAPDLRLGSCDAGALWLCNIWDLPGPRIELTSPALAADSYPRDKQDIAPRCLN